MLSLLEEVLLVALRDREDGSLTGEAEAGDLLSTALLMQLALGRRIQAIDNDLKVVDATPTGDDIADEGLTRVQQGRLGMFSALGIRYWIGFLRTTGIKDLSGRTLTRLVRKGILQRKEHRWLGFIPSQRYWMSDVRPRQDVVARIKAIVVGGVVPDPQTAALIAIFNATGFLDTLVSYEEGGVVPAQVNAFAKIPSIDNDAYRTVMAVQNALVTIVEEARKQAELDD